MFRNCSPIVKFVEFVRNNYADHILLDSSNSSRQPTEIDQNSTKKHVRDRERAPRNSHLLDKAVCINSNYHEPSPQRRRTWAEKATNAYAIALVDCALVDHNVRRHA